MDINRITNGGLSSDSLKTKKAREESKEVRSQEDRVELSDEAVSLFRTQESKRLEEIRERIESGYYSRPDVIEKVIDGLMRDLNLS